MGVTIPLVSAGASLAGGLLGQSNSGNVNLPQAWQAPYMTDAANQAYKGIRNLPATGYGNNFLPMYEQATQNIYNNPYAVGAQQGAGVAAQLGQQGAQNAYDWGGQQVAQAQSLVPYASQIMNTAFDPQQALYNRMLQQLQEQQRAGQSVRGIATTPYGAGLENDALRNFNIDWQNQQLNRQTQGAGAAGNLISTAGQQTDYGAALQNTAPGLYNTASAMPYNTAQGIGQGQQQALGSLFSGAQQVQNLAQTPIQEFLQYLQIGNQAGGVANQGAANALRQAGASFGENQVLGAGIGAGLQGIGQVAKDNNWNWLAA